MDRTNGSDLSSRLANSMAVITTTVVGCLATAGRRPRLGIDQGHFAKQFSGAEAADHRGLIALANHDVYRSRLDQVCRPRRVPLFEDGFAGGKRCRSRTSFAKNSSRFLSAARARRPHGPVHAAHRVTS